MKTQSGNVWWKTLRWVRLALSIGVLMVGFSVAIQWAWLRFQAVFGSIEYFATILLVGMTVGVILGLVLGIIGRNTIWITALSLIIALGLCVFVRQFWAATYRETSGLLGKHFVADCLSPSSYLPLLPLRLRQSSQLS